METPNLIGLLLILIFLSIFIFFAMKISSKEQQVDNPIRTKFEPRNVTYTKGVDPYEVEKPKRKKKRYYNKKKPAVANNATTEKRPVGRPRKTT